MHSQQPSTPPLGTSSPKEKKLLDQVRDAIRVKHYSTRTEQTYIEWIKRYILFHKKRHPKDMAGPEIEAFITHLAVERNVAVSTHIAPAVDAGGIRRLVPSCSYTNTYLIKNWICRPPSFAPVAQSACQQSSHPPRRVVS